MVASLARPMVTDPMSSWNRFPDSNDPMAMSSLGAGSSGDVTYTSWTKPEGVPTWLRPFNSDSRTRFTRTPEVLIRGRSKGKEPVPADRTPEAPAPEDLVAVDLALNDGLPDDSVSEDPAFAPGDAGLPSEESAAGETVTATDNAPVAGFCLPGEPLADDEVFIDWTGQTWAARIAEGAAQTHMAPMPQDEVTAPAPSEDAHPADEEPSVAGDLSVAVALPPAEAELLAADLPASEVVLVDEAPAPVEIVAAAVDVPVDILPAIARLAGLILVAPVVPAAAMEQDLVAVERTVSVEPDAVALTGDPGQVGADAEIAAEPAETVITGVIAEDEATIASAVVSDPAPSDAPEMAVADLAPVVEDEADATADAALVDDLPAAGEVDEAAICDVESVALPVSPDAEIAIERAADSAPAAEPAPAAMADSLLPVPAQPIPFLGLGLQLGGSLGWAFSAPAMPAPSSAPVAEEEAPAFLRRQLAAPEPAPAPAPAVEPARLTAPEGATSYGYELPPLELLTEPPVVEPAFEMSEEFLDRNSGVLQQTLRDFGVRGEVIDANPGPVVTLYEFEPAPGTKSSRVIGLSPDIARSMSAVSARVAVVEGRNVIGIELPNQRRETVWLRELIANHTFEDARARLGLCLGKTIGGEPVIADLARMPHLLVAGTTGSGKSVAINTMILSLLYRLTPEQCRLIMIDPKMLELSVYEGIPHLLTPVVTDPKKAIIALQWAVREMEDRYRKMARLKVRNIEGFNARVAEAREKGEVITFTVERGFDRETGETVVEEATLDLTSLPYIVIIVDEMADLMMVAGKDIEGAIQRLAQMARAAGIHLVMATQRPSVDVITGTIKANFPTRISFQVTSKIDSRTILGEMGAETLLGQGDMLYMANGGRITRVHGPFVSDGEVEAIVAHLKAQGRPEYLDAVTAAEEEDEDAEDGAVFDRTAIAAEDGGDHYEQAVAIVMRDRKASTSYIQRRLQVGYNKAASLMERMETEGIVGPANHAGKREILAARQG